jgi:hypothetical protein
VSRLVSITLTASTSRCATGAHIAARRSAGGVRTGTMVPSPTLGTYEWGMEGRVLRCPWHRWEFDLVTGRTLFGIDKRRLIQYRVSVEDGQVYLHPRPAEVRRLEAEGTMPVATEMEGDDGSDR